MISNYAYSRSDHIGPAVNKKLVDEERNLFQMVEGMDKKLQQATSPSEAAEMATLFSYRTKKLNEMWQDFFGDLFATYVDGYRTVPDPTNEVTGCAKEAPHFSEAWKKKIVQETGDHYKVPESLSMARSPNVISKLSLRALGGRGQSTSDIDTDLVVV